jgi:biotin synthase
MVFLCAISNISSGSCSEDCSFCTQSARFTAKIEKYKYKEISTIVDEAKKARENRAVGFCLVTSGKGMSDEKLEYVSKVASTVKKAVPSLNIIACNGTATLEELKELKKHGVGSYNHNLETSENFYKSVCLTHDWSERYQTCLNVKDAGLKLCSGGIFGMGESLEDRHSLISSLVSLNPQTVAINFFHPNIALPIKTNPLSVDEALSMITYVRKNFQNSKIMIAGGRERMFASRVSEIFGAGANAIVIGDYLTTSGVKPSNDIQMIESLGLTLAKDCNG